jgi:transcription initiation factor TFIIIB Brf1 subunit/transcription initiation factor TFIIB
MEVRVGEIAAKCPDCGSSDFVSTALEHELACRGCGKTVARLQLLIQIGEEASRNATESLQRLRRFRPAAPRKPRPQ